MYVPISYFPATCAWHFGRVYAIHKVLPRKGYSIEVRGARAPPLGDSVVRWRCSSIPGRWAFLEHEVHPVQFAVACLSSAGPHYKCTAGLSGQFCVDGQPTHGRRRLYTLHWGERKKCKQACFSKVIASTSAVSPTD